MTDTISNEPIQEPVVVVANNASGVDVVKVPVTEPKPKLNADVNIEPAPEPFRPWKDKKDESVVPEQAIPYSRFKEVNDERKTYAAKLEEYETKIAEYEKREKKIDEIAEPDDINIDDYPNDPKGYLKARDEALLNKAQKVWAQQQLDNERERATQNHINDLAKNYTKNLQESFTRNPEISEATSYFDELSNKKQIHPTIAYELMIDENVGELIYDIATNQKLLDEMIAASAQNNPTDFIRKLHKMSARIDRETRYANSDTSNSDTNTEPPKALDRKGMIMQAMPARIRSNPASSTTTDPENMSQSNYRKWREGQRKKVSTR
jgi:hypothetical protein